MPRRRYKLFIVCAAVFCFMLLRTYLNSQAENPESTKLNWPAARPPVVNDAPKGPSHDSSHGDANGNDLAHAADDLPPVHKPPPIPEDDRWKDNQAKPAEKGSAKVDDALQGEKGSDKEKGSEEYDYLTSKNPPKGPAGSVSEEEAADPRKVHWRKYPENFPVPEDKLITLPTGTPKQIPKVQYDFATETADAKSKREDRLKRVKAEISRSWAGYKKFAWMHDELAPVSGKQRDPFGSWGATLVDSLDTLWIAGLKDEFDEAAKAVAKIDFTWSPRDDIPVFETTIRYLGGLLAANDVSGGGEGPYPIFLKKAIELGDILMGVFDTPNRMPILYYRWKPEAVSQPHRASNRAGIAELGTLSMEFTRLAQVTGKQKYYDAVDRITNALVQFQKDGLAQLPGLFPENLDTSGCNQTATRERNSLNLSHEAQEQVQETDVSGEPLGHSPASGDAPKKAYPPVSEDDRIHRRAADAKSDSDSTSAAEPPFTARGDSSEFDCVPQGLVPSGYGHEVYHVGGSQDSAYEYFPKQYLLLGGLEPKYKKLHEDTVEAINKWLLYRPMIKGDEWDVVFPAKAATNGNPKTDLSLTYEVTHLTCFVGGMYGLGGKIFGREKDIEIAKQLTDGCVWAYRNTPSGLMPETSEVIACPTLDKCEFNETMWHDGLDNTKDWREEQLANWEKQQEQRSSLINGQKKDEPLEKKTAPKPAKATPQPASINKRAGVSASGDKLGPVVEDEDDGSKLISPDMAAKADDEPPPAPLKPVKPLKQGPAKADEDDGSKLPTTHAEPKPAFIPPPVDDVPPLKQGPTVEDEDDGSRLPASLDEKVDPPAGAKPAQVGQMGSGSSGGKNSGASTGVSEEKGKTQAPTSKDEKPIPPSVPKVRPSSNDRPTKTQADAEKPLSHKEYVEDKLKKTPMPGGMVNIGNHAYILRPEAIESVWYMYRITGDPEWMEKGWKMFEATMQATRSDIANSAIDNVMTKEPVLNDHMESFWLAETLKYYFLLFSEPSVISLDEWVLNTEAHPFKRPT
jgi:mannosyl-oligosaccharide alpha-1,2-mannosidase